MQTKFKYQESPTTTKSNSFFGSGTIQPKLTIGEPNDKYEQEADAMADKVMRMPQSAPAVQTKCAGCEQEENVQPKRKGNFLSLKRMIQRMCGSEEELQTKPMVQRMGAPEEETLQTKPLMMKSEGGGGVATSVLTSQLNSSKGGGSPLPASTNQFMSNAFGSDFSGVRVHTGSNAIQMNQGLGARAFTHGSDLYFNRGEYSPGSSDGKRLLGHELTHVVQQGGGGNSIQKKDDEKNNCWTTEDVIDSRIDNHAQSAMMEMFSRGGQQATDASAILSAVKDNQINGVYLPDQGVPAIRAKKTGSTWWTMIPNESISTCYNKVPIDEPNGKPLLVFRKRIKDNRALTASALSKAWQECGLPSSPPRCYISTINKPIKPEPEIDDFDCKTDQDCWDRGFVDHRCRLLFPDVNSEKKGCVKVNDHKCSDKGECDPNDPHTIIMEALHGDDWKCVPPNKSLGERCGHWVDKRPLRKDCMVIPTLIKKWEDKKCIDQLKQDMLKWGRDCAAAIAKCEVGDVTACAKVVHCGFGGPHFKKEECLKKSYIKYRRAQVECEREISKPEQRYPEIIS